MKFSESLLNNCGYEEKMSLYKIINDIFLEATLSSPENGHMITGGRQGIHTEHLGHLLSDMQYLQRSFPDAKW